MKKFWKGLLVGLGSIVILGSAFGAYYKLNLPEVITQSIMVTDNGTDTGNLIFWANTGGKNISYGQLLDSGGNTFLTGGALSPYTLLSSTGNWNTAFSWGDHSTFGYITTGIINSLNTGYLPLWSGVKLTDSNIFYSAGNIGIKTITPQWTLDVSGTIQSNVSFNLTGGFTPFRFVYSGNAVVPQLLSGSDRVAALYTGGEFVLP